MTHFELDDLERAPGEAPALVDALGRPLHDLRISVTDRCNFRCQYCMPKEIFGPNFAFLPRTAILSFEEITSLARLFVDRGVSKLRLTGGEPTLRADLPKLVGMLHELHTPDGERVEIAMTTNGTMLKHLARPLAEAGLDRVTVSLDSIDDPTFRSMNDMDFPVAMVLEGIEAATEAGLGPVKINAVVRRRVNDHTLVDLARHFRGTGHIVRFIEFMDVGNSNGWRMDEVLPAAELVEMIGAEFPLEAIEANYTGEVARRYRYRDGAGEIGLITSVTQPFCGTCTRARLSAEGGLYTCLFATGGVDLRESLRNGATDEELGALIDRTWRARTDRYSQIRTAETPEDGTLGEPGEGGRKVEMSFIGG
ncbi:MAG: GTP 3',8-cyclase MoaA [Chloroflexi bacterium]|nr:GTP 3',8-cyclase MoaA [Chloroflexota bacterium]MQC16911.1 GTP 3',8-cyclase MoaA [Chloroflexota bacterium]